MASWCPEASVAVKASRPALEFWSLCSPWDVRHTPCLESQSWLPAATLGLVAPGDMRVRQEQCAWQPFRPSLRLLSPRVHRTGISPHLPLLRPQRSSDTN